MPGGLPGRKQRRKGSDEYDRNTIANNLADFDCRIEPAGKWAQYKSMLVNCVVGLGLYQGLEFVLTHSPVELLSKTRIAWSRFRVARNLFSRSSVYELTLGRDQVRPVGHH